MSFDFLFKCIVVGDGAVGKTAATIRYATGTFADSYKMTIGVDFRVKIITLEGKKIKLQIWDTGGQERFANVRPLYYRGASGAIIMYDITSRDSFLGLPKWFDEVLKYCGELPWIIVGNKLDLSDQYRRVYEDEGESYAKQMNAEYFECSAKDGRNIETIFRKIALKMLEGAEAKKKPVVAAPTPTEVEVSVTESVSPIITSTVTRPLPIVTGEPFSYIEEDTVPYMLNTDSNDVLTQDIELATAFSLAEQLRSSDESLDSIAKVLWPMYIIPYKGGSFLLDGFKIVSNEFLITQIPASEEIQNILDASELKTAIKNLDRVKNLLSSLSARKFTVHALHHPSLLRDVIPFIERTASYKTVLSHKLQPDIAFQVASMFPKEFDAFSSNIINFRNAWSKISDSIDTKIFEFQEKANSLGIQIRQVYQDQLNELKKDIDQKIGNLKLRYEEQLDAFEKSLINAEDLTAIEELHEQINNYKNECDLRLREEEELAEIVQNGKIQAVNILESNKEKFIQLDTFIRSIETKQKELSNLIEEYSNKATTEEKQPEKFVVKDFPTEETKQIGLPFYCVKYVKGFKPRYMVIPPLILSPSGKYNGEKIDKSGKIFTPTSLQFLFKTKVEDKIARSEQFLNTVETVCSENNLLILKGVEERIQEGLEELFNDNIIDPQTWRWLKTQLDSIIPSK
jgi:small GTP-binding protein